MTFPCVIVRIFVLQCHWTKWTLVPEQFINCFMKPKNRNGIFKRKVIGFRFVQYSMDVFVPCSHRWFCSSGYCDMLRLWSQWWPSDSDPVSAHGPLPSSETQKAPELLMEVYVLPTVISIIGFNWTRVILSTAIKMTQKLSYGLSVLSDQHRLVS